MAAALGVKLIKGCHLKEHAVTMSGEGVTHKWLCRQHACVFHYRSHGTKVQMHERRINEENAKFRPIQQS